MTPEWADVAIRSFALSCVLWDVSPTFRALWRRLREELIARLRPVRTVLRGRLARDVADAMAAGGI